jgi:hypothetical protein
MEETEKQDTVTPILNLHKNYGNKSFKKCGLKVNIL